MGTKLGERGGSGGGGEVGGGKDKEEDEVEPVDGRVMVYAVLRTCYLFAVLARSRARVAMLLGFKSPLKLYSH